MTLQIGGGSVNAITLADSSGNANFAGDVQAPGIYVGSTNTSFDFYNNGTTYLNGATTVDAAFTQTGGAASTFSGTVAATGLTTSGVTNNFTHGTSWGINLQLTNTNDNDSPPVLTFVKDPASGHTTMADNDYVGVINFRADNSNNDIFSWVELSALAIDVTDGSEDSAFRIGTWGAGTEYPNTIMAKSGGVGINVASPGSYDNEANNLVVFDSTTPGITIATSTTTSRGSLLFADGTTNDQKYRGGVIYDHGTGMGGAADTMYLRAAIHSYLVLGPTGNVGIGTKTPDYKLNINSTGGADTLLKLENTTSNKYPHIRFTALDASYDIGVGGTGTATGYVNNFYIYDLTNSAPRITLTQAGNVGIGTTSPNAKLDVNGVVVFAPNTDGKQTFEFTTNASNDGRFLMKSDTTVTVDIQANDASYFNGGNVGIGTTTPKGKFHVKPDGNGWKDSMLLEHHSGDTGWFLHPENNSDNALWFGYNADTSVTYANQGATVALKLNSDLSATFAGKVGIGVTPTT
jgi:hypothetical protein